MKKFTLEKLKNEMQTISKDWHETVAKGHQGAGRTLEKLLGVPENNISLPDYGTIELKTKVLLKGDSPEGLITLFSKEPLPRASIPKLLKSMGYKHEEAGTKYPEGEKSFFTTITPGEFTPRGMTLDITKEKILINFDPKKVKKDQKDASWGKEFNNLGEWFEDVNKRELHYSKIMPFYFDRKKIEDQFILKLNNTFFCLCRKKKIEGKTYFKYLTGHILKNLINEKIDKMYSNGAKLDIRARTGHNHGTGFRMKKEALFSLFKVADKIL